MRTLFATYNKCDDRKIVQIPIERLQSALTFRKTPTIHLKDGVLSRGKAYTLTLQAIEKRVMKTVTVTITGAGY